MEIDKHTLQLKTERLIIRPMIRDDAPVLFEVTQNNTKLVKYMLWNPHKRIEEAYEVFDNLDPKNIDLVAFHEDRFIGKMVIRDIVYKRHRADISSADLGFLIAPKFQRRGYMTEALKEICRFCFEDLKLRRLTCGAMTENIASQRVQEKIGFRKVGIERKKFLMDGKFYDEYFYELLDEDFFEKKYSELNRFDEWNEIKKKIHKNAKIRNYKEREVYYTHLGKNVGFEQNGTGNDFIRPVVVLKKFNHSLFWGIPLTNQLKPGKHYYDLEFNRRKNQLILSQIKLIDAKRLLNKIGMIPKKDFVSIKKRIVEFLLIDSF